MATRMLIDATHEEETRVVVVKGNRVEEFDFETAARRPLKGNIYLARVTRVEPSLQAAFVDFGGNRHGFLAFNEIHPDYYQIPVADRERLKQEEAEAAAADEDDDDDEEEEEETSGKEGAAAGRGRRDAQGSETQGSETQGGETQGSDAGSSGDATAEEGAPAGQVAAALPAGAADAPTGDDEYARAEPEASAQPASPADLPAATLPERSGLRRVARLFGFGADEDPQGNAGGNAGAWQPAAADTDSRHDGDQDDDDRYDEDRYDDDRETSAVAHGDQDTEAGSDGRPQRDEPTAAGDAAGDVDGTQEPQALMLAEVDDEDRPAEERDDQVEAFGGDAVDEVRRRSSKRRPLTRRYKIQEVIKRRQILLVQVVKEERGNKGAALTTYMSLAGRYCVLMPNSPNGGGISRKIVSATDRKRLKGITGELDVPEGMGMIVRTAGMERTRAEIKRDFEFLLRTWDNIRELTLASMAPCLVYEEANLIKRAIRDVYNKDVDEVLVEGENGYRHAKDFMKMLMPSHSKRVQPYKDRIPLFHRYQVENQLDEMFYPTVQLKSGGYIVINATEALVAIDVNSGRSTKEHNIEGTAYKTNMEAAEEVARQLRLRDMAGLIVIDFIDMDDGRNARNVERKLKECLKLDRARIQVGRISSFGLLEMSRQRLRPSLVEQSMVVCPHCDGQGHVRSVESAAIRAIRAAEDEGIRERSAEVTLIVPTTVAIYLLNSKREVLQEIEGRYGIRVLVKNDDELGPSDFSLERSKTRSDGEPPVQKVITAESVPYRSEDDDEDEDESDSEPEAEAAAV
ncbi:Rne/Rng family ribonuclease, partial [Marinibaculum pumilum]